MKNAPNSLARQLSREAKWSVYLTVFYLIGWVLCAYFVPVRVGVFGFPLWFELSCVFLPIVFFLVSVAVLKGIYKEVDLDAGIGEMGDDA